MARTGKPAGNKKTSFGKRTEAEKSFRERKKETRGESSQRSGRGKFSGPSKFSSSRFDKEKPRGEGRSSFGPKSESDRPFKKSNSGFKRDGKGSSSRFKKDEGSTSPRENRFSKTGNFSKPHFDRDKSGGEGKSSFGRKSASGPFRDNKAPRSFTRKRDDDKPQGDRRFSKREGGFSSGREKKFSKPFNRRQEDSKEPRSFSRRNDDNKLAKREEGFSSDREKKFSKPFEKRTEGTDRFSKFKKENEKSFVRKTDQDSEFDKPEREKREFKKPSLSKEKKSSPLSFDRPKKTEVPESPKLEAGDGLVRLNKFMANSGVGSRREADEYIKMGLVTVNGETITEMGHKVKPTDDIRYEGRRLKAEPMVYILLNKPKGFITTTDDPEERKTVMDLVASACKERVYPVGRLDRNTTGLLLITNDGDLADKLTHPSYNAKKIYKVELDRPLTKADFQKILDGVYFDEGRAQVDDLAIVSDDGKEIGIEIHIGWNRIVRRIFEALGYQIERLDRVMYAGLDKKDLGRGQWRFLKPEEVVRLKHFKA
jgi:23S rRNA pseudouridine2605 synthase